MSDLSLGLTQGLKGSVSDFHTEVKKLERPYKAIAESDFKILCNGDFDYYLDLEGRVVTFGGTDGGYALMPLNSREAKKVLAKNDLQ